MRIEVSDELACLRRQETPIKCGQVTVLPGESTASRFERPVRDCDDCGNELVGCRCNPGEG